MRREEINVLCQQLAQRGLGGSIVTVTGVAVDEADGQMHVDLIAVTATPIQWTAFLQPGLTPERMMALRTVIAYLEASPLVLDRTHADGLRRVFGLEKQKGGGQG